MRVEVDEAGLDDAGALAAADPGGMLLAVAAAGAQVRAAVPAAEEAGLVRLAEELRPRSLVVVGVGGSAVAGDALAAVIGRRSPLPVTVVRDSVLPGWVGAADLVVAVSASGWTEETLAAAADGARRGAVLAGVTAGDSPVADVVRRARGPVVPVPAGHSPRASLWSMLTPLLLLAAGLGATDTPAGRMRPALAAAADRLTLLATGCRPAAESFVNPAKQLALEVSGSLSMAWGSSPLATAAAYRWACQAAENAKTPSLWGGLPEALHNAVVAFDGPWAGGADDLFLDPADRPARLRLLLLRDPEEDPGLTPRLTTLTELAAERGVPVTEVVAEGESRVERLASLVGLLDFASVYLALVNGIDPSPIGAINELKRGGR